MLLRHLSRWKEWNETPGHWFHPEEQRRVAEVSISIFLDATLKGRTEYLPLFKDPQTARDWLPPTIYVSRFDDGATHVAADFEEDIDVTRGSSPGVTLVGIGLSLWKEARLYFRDMICRLGSPLSCTKDWDQENSVVYRGGTRGGSPGPAPAYVLSLDERAARELKIGADSSLRFERGAAENLPVNFDRAPPEKETWRERRAREKTEREYRQAA